MKWLSIAGKCVLNLNSNGKKTERFLIRAGLTLIEFILTIGVSSIIVLGAGSTMVFVADSFSKIVDKDEAESSVVNAAYTLRIIATQAVNLFGVANTSGEYDDIGTTGTGSANNLTRGRIFLSVNTMTTFGACPGTIEHCGRIVELAVFYREAALTGNSDFHPTGIFFKTPWMVCPPGDGWDATFSPNREMCSGQLIVVTSNAGTNTLGPNLFSPPNVSGQQILSSAAGNYIAHVFDRLTYVDLLTNTTGDGYARDARFKLTARYFLGGKAEDFNYLPQAGATSSNFKELTMEVFVGFRDNYLGKSQLVTEEAERLHGGLYYFPFTSTLKGI